MGMTKTAKTATCTRCHATLRSAAAVKAGKGRTCARKDREDARIEAIEAAAELVDVSAFKDAKDARDKGAQILVDRSLVPTRFACRYLAVASDGSGTYLVDTVERSCPCKAQTHWGRCSHLVAADIAEILTLAA